MEGERQAFFELYHHSQKSKLNNPHALTNRMSIMYRLQHATDKKYIDLYRGLKALLIDKLHFKFKDTDTEYSMINELFRLYHAHNTLSDSLEIEFKSNILKAFPEQKLKTEADDLYNLFRILESIDTQSATIFSIPIEVDKKVIKEFTYKESSGYNAFRYVASASNLEFYDQGYSSDEEEGPKKEQKIEKKVDYTEHAKQAAEYLSKVEDITNHFKEFYERFKYLIFQREFWALFLNEIMDELKSSKSKEDLFALFMGPEYFNDVDAAQYLVTYREQIIQYSRFMTFEAQKKEQQQQKKKKEVDTKKPTNFGVKGNFKSEEYAMYEEGNQMPVNQEVLATLVISAYFLNF